jgi:CYTH domain-containing protein
MPITRSFLLAPSLARLIEKERGSHRVMEGYFSNRSNRNTCVRVEDEIGSLVLVRHDARAWTEESTGLPRSQAEALLDLAQGRIVYRRIPLSLAPGGAQVRRFTAPGLLDLVWVEFDQDEHARQFQPLAWFGAEVTSDSSYRNQFLALDGLPAVSDVEPTDAALSSLLDSLENRTASRRPSRQRAWLKERAAS